MKQTIKINDRWSIVRTIKEETDIETLDQENKVMEIIKEVASNDSKPVKQSLPSSKKRKSKERLTKREWELRFYQYDESTMEEKKKIGKQLGYKNHGSYVQSIVQAKRKFKVKSNGKSQKHWSTKEKKILKTMFKNNMSYPKIAKRLKRSIKAVTNQADRMKCKRRK